VDTTAAGAEPAAALHPAELRGRASGTGIMAFFALAWTVWGTTGMASVPGKVVFGVGVVLTVVFFVLAARLHRMAAHVPVTVDDPLTDEVKQHTASRFRLILVIEWIPIIALGAILGSTGHTEALPALIALVVGLHFIPLATLFRVSGYRTTGIAICMVAVIGALLAVLLSKSILWTLIPGLGSALILYLTSGYLIRGTSVPNGTLD
jgi:hypothetical protein